MTFICLVIFFVLQWFFIWPARNLCFFFTCAYQFRTTGKQSLAKEEEEENTHMNWKRNARNTTTRKAHSKWMANGNGISSSPQENHFSTEKKMNERIICKHINFFASKLISAAVVCLFTDNGWWCQEPHIFRLSQNRVGIPIWGEHPFLGIAYNVDGHMWKIYNISDFSEFFASPGGNL